MNVSVQNKHNVNSCYYYFYQIRDREYRTTSSVSTIHTHTNTYEQIAISIRQHVSHRYLRQDKTGHAANYNKLKMQQEQQERFK